MVRVTEEHPPAPAPFPGARRGVAGLGRRAERAAPGPAVLPRLREAPVRRLVRAARRPHRRRRPGDRGRHRARTTAGRWPSSATRRAATWPSARTATSAWPGPRATARRSARSSWPTVSAIPILTFVDTPGAYPGVGAEQAGPGGHDRRARSSRWPASACPWSCSVIGEGGSGGALAIAVGDRILMQENAIYSVISPEGCAAILWKDAGQARKAAYAFRPTARACLDLGVIDVIVPEPSGGAHQRPRARRPAARRGDPHRPRRGRGRAGARAPPRPRAPSSARWASGASPSSTDLSPSPSADRPVPLASAGSAWPVTQMRPTSYGP